MDSTLDIKNPNELNEWVRRSLKLFQNTPYLDNILKVYPLQVARPERLDSVLRRKIIMAHQGRKTKKLIELLKGITKFSYDDPIWYLLKNISGCFENNPVQVKRIAETLYLKNI